MELYSYSRLSLYETCPLRFYFRYVLEKPEPVTKPLAIGKAVHRGIETLVKGGTMDNALAAAFAEAEAAGLGREEGEEIRDLIAQAPVPEGEAEVHFELPLSSPESGLRLQGYIDLVCDVNAFVDWKTNWRPYQPDETRQLALYAWAMMELKKSDRVQGTLYFLRHGLPLSRVYTREEAEAAQQWAFRTARDIRDRVFLAELHPEEAEKLFPPRAGPHCRTCPFAEECWKRTSAGP